MEEVLSLFKKLASLAFQYRGMGSFGFLLSSYQKLPSFFVFFPFSHIGSVSVTVDEMQTAEIWQLLSGGRVSGSWP